MNPLIITIITLIATIAARGIYLIRHDDDQPKGGPA
jgi:hypothetical protein